MDMVFPYKSEADLKVRVYFFEKSNILIHDILTVKEHYVIEIYVAIMKGKKAPAQSLYA